MKKATLIILGVMAILVLGLLGYSAVSYLLGPETDGSSIQVLTRGCFLKTPLCVVFPDSQLPPLWTRSERQGGGTPWYY